MKKSTLKRLSLALAAAMLFSCTAVGAMAVTAEGILEYVQGGESGDFHQSAVYEAMLEAGDGILDDTKDGQLSTDEAAAVKSLDLSGKNIISLKGIEYCTRLTSLNLSGNSIEDIGFLSQMTELTDLDLSGNKIKVVAPLSSLTGLESLNLSGNPLSTAEGLGDELDSLTDLDISGTGIVDLENGLPSLSALTDLNASDIAGLDAQDNPTGVKLQDLSGLTSFTTLTTLDLSDNQIADISPLASLTGLTSLDLSGNQISKIPSDFSDLSSLTSLDLSGNLITDESQLENLPESFEGSTEGWVNAPDPETPDTGELQTAVTNAQALKAATVVSEDGAGVSEGRYWVSQEAMTAFEDAIADAQAVLDDPESGEAVSSAVTALTEAVSAFTDARTEGTAAAGTEELQSIIDDAQARIETADPEADAEAIAELEEAIEAARAVMDGTDDSTSVADAISALREAVTTFNENASYTDPDDPGEPDDPAPETPSASSGRERNTFRDDNYEFWLDVEDQILDAEDDEELKVDACGYDRMPFFVMAALWQRSDVSLEIDWIAGDDIVIPAGEALARDVGRIFYNLSYLQEQYLWTQE